MTRQQIAILTTLVILSACGQNSTDIKKVENISPVTVDSSKTMKVIPPTPKDNLKIARQFAEDFVVDTTGPGGKLNYPDSVVKAFKAIRYDRPNQEKYLTLFYLKILRGHLQCCHQTYEIRKISNTMYNTKGIDSVADPLLHEYNLIIQMFDNSRRYEFISSGLAETWLEKNKQLLKYDKIKAEYKIIRTIETNIEKGVYWKLHERMKKQLLLILAKKKCGVPASCKCFF